MKFQIEMNPRKKPCATEVGKVLRCLKKTNVTEYVIAHSVQLQKIESTGDLLAIFKTSTGWKIDEETLQGLTNRAVCTQWK